MELVDEPNTDSEECRILPSCSILSTYTVHNCSFGPSLVYGRMSRKPIEAQQGSRSEFPEFATFASRDV